MTGVDTVTLYRPIGQAELDLIRESGYSRFPPRLPEQLIFYPVLKEAYAAQIARDWNARRNDPPVGYVTRFEVRREYIERFEVHVVGGSEHAEYWIPAEELEEFNGNIVGSVEVITEYRSDGQVIAVRHIEVLELLDWYDGIVQGVVSMDWRPGVYLASLVAFDLERRRRVYAMLPLTDGEAAALAILGDWDSIQAGIQDLWSRSPAQVPLVLHSDLDKCVLAEMEVQAGVLGDHVLSVIEDAIEPSRMHWFERFAPNTDSE